MQSAQKLCCHRTRFAEIKFRMGLYDMKQEDESTDQDSMLIKILRSVLSYFHGSQGPTLGVQYCIAFYSATEKTRIYCSCGSSLSPATSHQPQPQPQPLGVLLH